MRNGQGLEFVFEKMLGNPALELTVFGK